MIKINTVRGCMHNESTSLAHAWMSACYPPSSPVNFESSWLVRQSLRLQLFKNVAWWQVVIVGRKHQHHIIAVCIYPSIVSIHRSIAHLAPREEIVPKDDLAGERHD